MTAATGCTTEALRTLARRQMAYGFYYYFILTQLTHLTTG